MLMHLMICHTIRPRSILCVETYCYENVLFLRNFHLAITMPTQI